MTDVAGVSSQQTSFFLLHVQVKDDKAKCTLGNLTVALSGLLAEEDMTLTQSFPLRNSGPSSSIKLKMALRVKEERIPSHSFHVHSRQRSVRVNQQIHSNGMDYEAASC